MKNVFLDAKINSEFGEYVANTIIKIFNGESPSDIPLSVNKRAKIYLNMAIAKKLNIKFPINLIEKATLTK
jgi:ABC-type uncharacterized transport system substrate-binding protein